MRDDDENDRLTAAALARANEIEADAIASIERLIARSRERDVAGRPTAKAKSAAQALASPALTSTLASVALKRSIKPALNAALDQVERTETEYRTAVAGLRALQARKELYEAARGVSRKRAVVDQQLEAEEWKLISELRARSVPTSALDQLTEPELDFIAGLFVEKQKDFRHRGRAGAWWTLVRAGLLDVRSEGFNEDERAAILLARDADAVRARQAYDALCELAGRQLDIPHSFAEFVLAFAEESNPGEPIGAFERNVSHLKTEQWRADADKILDLLGLSKSELSRASRLMRSPALVSYKEAQRQAHEAIVAREAEYQVLLASYRPAARAALAERHDADRQRERERIGADALGQHDMEAALKLLGIDDEELSLQNARVTRQVREGVYFSDREAERQRAIEQLAAELAVSPAMRRTVAGMGIRLPQADLPVEQPADPAPVVRPVTAKVGNATPGATIETTPEAPASNLTGLSLAEDFGLGSDVTQEAAAAYYEIARTAALTYHEWPELTWPYAKADSADPASVAAMVGEFEQLERDGQLNEISQRYLSILRSQSISAANDFLIGLNARQLIGEVANGYDFEEHRRKAGFPRPSQARW